MISLTITNWVKNKKNIHYNYTTDYQSGLEKETFSKIQKNVCFSFTDLMNDLAHVTTSNKRLGWSRECAKASGCSFIECGTRAFVR